MKNSRDFRPGKGRSDSRFDRRDQDSSRMFQATCSNCGNSCEVPFQPSGDRPVYCKECFAKNGDRDSRFSGGRNDRQQRFGEKRMFTATCANCGNSCEVPFKPTGEKPVYCKDCFGKMGMGKSQSPKPQSHGGTQQLAEQLSKLNSKLDIILSVLKPGAAQAPTQKAEIAKTKKTIKAAAEVSGKSKAKIAKSKKRIKKSAE